MLPDEIWLIIFNFINIKDLVNFSKSERKSYNLVKDEHLWKEFGKRDFGDSFVKMLKDNKDNKEIYILCYQISKLKEKLFLTHPIDKLYHMGDLYLEDYQTKQIDNQILNLQNLKYLYVSNIIKDQQIQIIQKMKLTKFKIVDESNFRGQGTRYILLGMDISIKDDNGKRLKNIEDGFCSVLFNMQKN